MDILLSVIVPVFNVGSFLTECLESIINSSYDNIEILVIDDGSNDHSADICDQFANQDKRVRVVHQSNAGLCGARNRGLEIAKGDWIMFVDGDDWISTEYVSGFVEHMNNSDIDVIYSLCAEKELENNTDHLEHIVTRKEFLNNFDDFWGNTPLVPVWKGCYRRRVLVENNVQFLVGLKMAEDVEFHSRLLSAINSICFIKHCGYHYRKNEFSQSHTYDPNFGAVQIIICDNFETLLGRILPKWRWYYMHESVSYYTQYYKISEGAEKQEIRSKIKAIYKEPYYHTILGDIRRKSTLDEKLETFFLGFYKQHFYRIILHFLYLFNTFRGMFNKTE